MNKEEKRRIFHEALKEMLFPPPPISSPPSPPHPSFNLENPDFDLIPDECGLSSDFSNDDERECASEKICRAKRKRVRKKKMKEDVLRRKGMVGPLLPVSGELEGVRGNVSANLCDPAAPYSNQSKVKQRRRAKKLAKEKTESTIPEKSQQDCDPLSNTKA